MAAFMNITGLALALAVAVQPVTSGEAFAAGEQMLAQRAVDCRAAAMRVAAEEGGQLLSVRESGGECVIVVLVQGSGNERPRKVTRRVSQ
ncbi:hypothetical protein [Rhizobium sp. AAP43]|uniref:hypothetical protein n=1 Tax=Rhizobium sp. AAP43 TaxID=1523420 RepID=UPI0006CDBFD6|nr:hypothetical protein [Rhizobium sp. AAP43]KPF41104.1 hypothetical protein IP76_22305 [Rhizobium sp. AAP43]